MKQKYSVTSLLFLTWVQLSLTLSLATADPADVSECLEPSNSDCIPIDTVFQIEDPFDCYNYYLCIVGEVSLTTYRCDEGTFFDTETAGCEDDVNGTCTDRCFIKHACSSADCNDDDVIAFADENSCTNYFMCDLQNNPISASCQFPNSYFNGEQCTDDPSQCCSITQCQPYCGEGSDIPFTNVADPCDCTSYYLCEHEDSVPTIRGSCPPDYVFDGFSSCSESAVCDTICTAEQCLA